MSQSSFGILVVVCFAALTSGQSVKPGQVSVRADKQVVELPILYLKGNVEIVTEKITIRADEADFNITTGKIEARDNLRFGKASVALEKGTRVRKLQMNVNKPGQVVFMVSVAQAAYNGSVPKDSKP